MNKLMERIGLLRKLQFIYYVPPFQPYANVLLDLILTMGASLIINLLVNRF